MELDKTLDGLRRLRGQATCFACSGCGMEHNCSDDGCRIIRSSIEQLQKLSRELSTSEAARTELQKQLVSARQELAEVKAEQAGRLVVLPCKVGDTVWYITPSTEVCEAEVIGIWLNVYTNPQMWLEIKYRSKFAGECEHKSRIDLMLGKILFLTREEAEAALAGKGGEGDVG